ncbi:MAG: TonB family protein [Rhodothermales bacterium]
MALSKLNILNERYVLRNKLGEPGLYDTTYLAWNLMKKETAVVVREFNPTFLMSRSKNGENLAPTSGPAERLFDYGLNCFIREADATGLIKHPNVIQQYAYFRENNTAYSVSAYHPGATLAAVLQGQEGRIQERAAFAIIVPLLDGLMAGHRKGLIHGRLSPSQVFLTKSGRPMILRFHVTQILLARRCGRASDIATPGFTPPELLLADGKKGPWSDVYASAATLYSIITGKRPPQTMKRYDNDPFPDILHKEKEISKGLKKVLNRAMALDWNDRPQTILELKQEILEQMPATSRPYEMPAVALESGQAEILQGSDIQFEKTNTAAEDIAILSREALAKSPVKVKKPEHQPLSLEEIDSPQATEWLPKLKERENSGDGIVFKKEPGLEPNPLGPLASEVTYLTPTIEDRPIQVREIRQELSNSPLKQVVNSATANRTRKLSIAAIAACIVLFTVVGIYNGFEPGFNTQLPANEFPIEALATNTAAVQPVFSQQQYMSFLADADSLQQRSHELLALGDTMQHTQVYAKAYDVYRQILNTRPSDSLALAQMEHMDSFSQALQLSNVRSAIIKVTEAERPTLPVVPKEVSRNIAQGDSLMALGQYDAARPLFAAAQKIAPGDTHVAAMLTQIDNERDRVAKENRFRRLSRQGDLYLKEEALEEAKESYAEALKLKPNNTAAQTRLNDVTALILQRETSDTQFASLKEDADELFAQGSYSSALLNYEAAQKIRPDDLFIEEQIKEVKKNLQELEAIVKQRNSQYSFYKQTADSLFEAGNLDEALSTYRITDAIKPGDIQIADRIESILQTKSQQENIGIDEEGIFLIPETTPVMIDNSGIIKKLVYPSEARKNGIEGMVVVKMMIDETGQPSRMEILKGIGYGCDREAMRVLKKARFEPATFKGKPVKAWHTHPIKFKILK